MMLRGQNRIATVSRLPMEWRHNAVVSFGRDHRPSTPSIRSGMHLIGADSPVSSNSAQQQSSDNRRRVH
jgi:hypothetical protein